METGCVPVDVGEVDSAAADFVQPLPKALSLLYNAKAGATNHSVWRMSR